MFNVSYFLWSKEKVTCLTSKKKDYESTSRWKSFIYAFYAHKEHLKKVACLTFCAFYAHKKHLSEKSFIYAFYAHKEHLSESRLFMLFMLIKFSRKKIK